MREFTIIDRQSRKIMVNLKSRSIGPLSRIAGGRPVTSQPLKEVRTMSLDVQPAQPELEPTVLDT